MGEHRTISSSSSSSRNHHLFDVGLNNRVDLFLRSESPREQEIFLKQKLHEEIEKNSLGRVRYVDSELYLRNNRRSPSGLTPNDQPIEPDTKQAYSRADTDKRDPELEENSTTNDLQKRHQQQQQQQSQQQLASNDRNCQVCLIKEMRQDLMNINKVIQERNEQISKLKSKCLRSYFRRQLE